MWDDESPQDHEAKEECLMVDIIAAKKATGKFFYRYRFGENLSSVPQNRLTEIICSLAMKGNQSKTSDFAELRQGFRTTMGIFCPKANGMSGKYPKSSRQKCCAKHLNWLWQSTNPST